MAEGRSDYRALVIQATTEADPGASPAADCGRPSLLARAANLATAAVAHAASGFAHADDAERDRRLAICRGCPDYRHDSGTCSRCGCLMRIKSAWLSSQCPQNPPRW